MSSRVLFAIAVALLAAAGCQAPEKPVAPKQESVPKAAQKQNPPMGTEMTRLPKTGDSATAAPKGTEPSDEVKACLSNVKQIGLGLLMLSSDNNDTVYAGSGPLSAGLGAYVKNSRIFHCPKDEEKGESYSLNSDIAGLSTTKVEMPNETVMVYEGKNKKLEFRHEGTAAVCFADGHAKMVSQADAAKLRWKP